MKKILFGSMLLITLLAFTGCGSGGGDETNSTPTPAPSPAPKPMPTPASAPVITTQPAPAQTVTAGTNVSFTVVATGTAPLSYQWKKESDNVGTNNTSFNIVSAQTAHAGSYTVTVSNSAGSATSNAATLTITQNTGYLPGDVMAAWEGGPSYYSKWTHGPSTASNLFPIAVWLQSVGNINAYRAIGVNFFVGLWEGPNESQLSAHSTSQMPVICDQNAVGLSSVNNGIIKSWLQMDEPDNAQNGTEVPVPTADIITRYNAMVASDASRPVYLNLGQGVAADLWYGRGQRTNHPEDYAQYALGGDILSFDIYPMNVYPVTSGQDWYQNFHNTVAQNIWYVALGVDRLRLWTDYKKPVWAWLESTNIGSNANYALTPVHVKAEVWMAIIHGARGIGYFTHVFTSAGGYVTDSGLLSNSAMRDAVSTVNAQITSLASVLNTQSVANGVTTVSSNSAIPVNTMVKREGGFTYVFAVTMRPGTPTATFTLRGFTGSSTVEVVGEGRTIAASGGVFHDAFTNYAVHIYKVPNP